MLLSELVVIIGEVNVCICVNRSMCNLSRGTRMDSLVLRMDSLASRKDFLVLRKDSLVLRKDSLASRKDSLVLRLTPWS